MRTRRNRTRWDLTAALVLVALLFRAYVPVGFMPAAGAPFRLELCPAAGVVAMNMAMSMVMPEGHEHHHPHQPHLPGHSHYENCPFGSAPASGPVSQLIVFPPPVKIASLVNPPILPIRPPAQFLRAHPPRGPPSTV